MEATCLGDLFDKVNYTVECVDMKSSKEYDRNLQLMKRLNLGGLYKFLKALSNTFSLNYISTSRPTRLEYDSSTRQLLKTLKSVFSNKRRRVNFSPNVHSSATMEDMEYGPPNVDFFVNDKQLVVVSPYQGGNLRVTTIPTGKESGASTPHTESSKSKGLIMNTGLKSFLVVTGNESQVTTLCVNEFFGFGFEVFAGFADKAVCFFRMNLTPEAELYDPNAEYGATGCYNLTGYLNLGKVPLTSKFSPNRELVLASTRKSLYLLEKSGFDLEYEKLCEFKPGSLVCADFLNDFEIMVLENNGLLTMYKKYNLKFNVYIRYNLGSLLTQAPTADRAEGATVNSPAPGSSGTAGGMVRDPNGNVFILVKDTALIKLTWNETLIPYSNVVSFQTPNNMVGDNQDRRFITDFNVENNLIVVTFRGSDLVHLYSLTSFKEIHHLKPPRTRYTPTFVKSCSDNNFCYLVVLWSYKGFESKIDGIKGPGAKRRPPPDYVEVEMDVKLRSLLENGIIEREELEYDETDIVRTYKIKSALTRTSKSDDVSQTTYSKTAGMYPTDPAPRKLPQLSSLNPKIKPRYTTRFNDFNKYDDSFANRKHILGRKLDTNLAQENIYSIDEFIRNRRTVL
ncbi:conserved hypothetical protein [Theileria orientalis strain Shintoku]|uniref:Uncharacterized protein n=1 Tax=Theileria orientalis strain Shintoku TaxID=869250 RepID=J4C3F1_THEOR|nr:conserved hypothetical protein [Theileria orientalis strain Shintoku]BAM40331.1 conserved hypothetical protein [Theileria orientalis strain Shintoku]|eukprot:XP_009690632.1 conserved hypothetical protein [Theileria orientalis strain Shintoku]